MFQQCRVLSVRSLYLHERMTEVHRRHPTQALYSIHVPRCRPAMRRVRFYSSLLIDDPTPHLSLSLSLSTVVWFLPPHETRGVSYVCLSICEQDNAKIYRWIVYTLPIALYFVSYTTQFDDVKTWCDNWGQCRLPCDDVPVSPASSSSPAAAAVSVDDHRTFPRSVPAIAEPYVNNNAYGTLVKTAGIVDIPDPRAATPLWRLHSARPDDR